MIPGSSNFTCFRSVFALILLLLDVIKLQEPVLLLDVCVYITEVCAVHVPGQWTYAYTTGTTAALGRVLTTFVCAAPGRVYTRQGPELHLDMSGQQEPVMLLDMSTLYI